MKRLLSLLCLLLCVCICFPVFSLLTFATSVNGYQVYYSWRGADPSDLPFENTIISNVAYNSIRIQTDIILTESIKSNQAFDFNCSLNFAEASTVTLDSLVVYDNSNNRLGTFYANISNNQINVNGIQVEGKPSFIRLFITVTQPSWIVNEIFQEITFSIDNINFTAIEDMTFLDWVNSEFNTIGLVYNDGYFYSNDSKKRLELDSIPVTDTFIIESGKNYELKSIVPTATFVIEGVYYKYEKGMTWADWVSSEYNTSGFKLTPSSFGGIYGVMFSDYTVIKYNYALSTIGGVQSTDIIHSPWSGSQENYVYGSQSYVEKLGNQIPWPGSTISMYSTVQYLYDFSVTSVSLEVQDESGLLNGIIGWLKNVYNGIIELPSKIANFIGDQIRGLFIPSEESIIELKSNFEQLLQDRFGAVYDSADIIDDFASSFSYTETDTSVSFPEVTVNLAGTDFTFGGWEVDVIPDGFEGIVDALKLLVSIVSTVWFVNALRKRLEDILE